MKRFTETLKWDDPWFRTLAPEMKCFWNYLVDKCDHAGVWEVDLAAASFFVGAEIDHGKVLKAFGERIESLSGGSNGTHAERWRVIKFVHFQYPNLSRECKPHGPVFAAIEKHGLQPDKVKCGLRSSPSDPKALNTLPVGSQSLQDKDQDKDQETEGWIAREIAALPEPLKHPDFIAQWEIWLVWWAENKHHGRPMSPETAREQLGPLIGLPIAAAVQSLKDAIAGNYARPYPPRRAEGNGGAPIVSPEPSNTR